MTKTHVPAEPEAPARPAPALPPGPALHLAYATPPPPQKQWPEFVDVVAMLIRRFLFAVGVGLFVYGIVEAFGERRGDAAVMAGWGAALVALVVPFPGLWRYWPTDPVPGGRRK